eukprot:TRINITY_DN15861_c0_g1_i1.p1 TRINITY_DN15861_c0_g1~~TRINITY_DN15861_c0_g1_i1.p1  ORF type:complete len:522 (+),score=73.66 TRINITY_DN15861_c0_g1_i1:57-1622(+)
MLALPTVLLAALAAVRPNILYILLDDYGWADAGWHRPQGYTDVQTPHMNKLVKEGIELDRHYTYKFCSPTRCAVQSGRNPVHVNVLNLGVDYRNPNDTISGYTGIPRNMTGLAEVMKSGGYSTHMYGKWDAGMATVEHTPQGRGYDDSLHYFHHMNDYWNMTIGECNGTGVVDLWETNMPARGLNNTDDCSQQAQHRHCVYEEELFTNRVLNVINNPARPFFVFWSAHIVHNPYAVPQSYLDRFSFISDPLRRIYHAMTYYIDEAIGNVTDSLKQNGLWDSTVVIVHTDNGGALYPGDAGNNYPLKGGKMSNWEGGIRTNAFISGGHLPPKAKGTRLEGLITAWDWYATLANLAGVDPRDEKAEKAGLPPIDSIDMWDYLTTTSVVSPRDEILLGSSDTILVPSPTKLGGLIKGRYKILIGSVSQAGWPGPLYPNATTTWNSSQAVQECGDTASTGCLYDIFSDPTEHINLAPTHPEVWKQLKDRMDLQSKGLFSPDRGSPDPTACEAALGVYQGFWGPFA